MKTENSVEASSSKVECRLLQLEDEVVELWRELLHKEIPQTQQISEPALLSSIPLILKQVDESLSCDQPEERWSEMKLDLFPHYSLAEILNEYAILRQALFAILDKHDCLTAEIQSRIGALFFDCIERTANSFTEWSEEVVRLASGRNLERYQMALDAGQIGIWEYDLNTGQITWSPNQFKIYRRDPKKGPPNSEEFSKLLYEADRSYVEEKIKESLESKGPVDMEFRIRWPDRSIRWIQSKGKVILDNEGNPVRSVGANLDITVRKKIENERLKLLSREREARQTSERAIRRLHDLQNITETALTQSTNMDFLLRDVVSYIKQSFKCDLVATLMLTPDKSQFELKSHVWPRAFSEKLYCPKDAGIPGQIYKTGEAILVDDVYEMESSDSMLRTIGIKCLIAAPLRTAEGVIGVIEVGRVNQRIFSHQDLTFLQLVADQVSIAADTARLFAELHNTLNDVAEEQQMRERFVTTLSHDMRTPLAAAKMSVEILNKQTKENKLKPEFATSLLTKAEENLIRTDQMIQNLLDVHRYRVGIGLNIRISKVDLKEILCSIVDDLKTVHGDRFIIQCDDELTGYWCSNSLRRIVENLCNNAVKYGSRTDPIRIIVFQQGELLHLSVRNNGVMSNDEVKHLTQHFTTPRSFINTRAKGSGLGLTIVKALTEGHGGKVTLQSDDTTTTFEVILPMDGRATVNPNSMADLPF